MKKLFSLIVLTIIISGNLFSQDCLNDVYYTLVNQGQFYKAKNQFDKKCMPGNESNANFWLMKGNIYIKCYLEDLEKFEKDNSKPLKNPDLIIEAYDAFIKSQELNPAIEPMPRLFSAKEGIIKCAIPLQIAANGYFNDKKYEKAIQCFELAQKCFIIEGSDKNKRSVFATNVGIYNSYRNLNDIENSKKFLKQAYSYDQLNIVSIYEDRFALFLADGDTSKCLNLIKRAYRNIPDTLPDQFFRIQMLEVSYLFIIHEYDSMKVLATSMLNNISIDSLNQNKIIEILDYLLNIGAIPEVNSVIEQYLNKYPNDYTFIVYKGDVLLKNAVDLDKEADKVRNSNMNNSDKIKRQNEIKVEKDNKFAEALFWYEKAYLINNTDKHVIKNLYRIKKTTYKPIDPELEQKFQEIMTNTPK